MLWVSSISKSQPNMEKKKNEIWNYEDTSCSYVSNLCGRWEKHQWLLHAHAQSTCEMVTVLQECTHSFSNPLAVLKEKVQSENTAAQTKFQNIGWFFLMSEWR